MSKVVDMEAARKRLRPASENPPKSDLMAQFVPGYQTREQGVGKGIDLMASFSPENIIAERVNTADTVPTAGNELSLPFRDPAKGAEREAPVIHERSDEAFEAAMMREFSLVFEPDEL